MVVKRSVVRTARTELTDDDIKDIEKEIERGRSSASIALDYEISSPEVSAIRRNFNRREKSVAPRADGAVAVVSGSSDEKLLAQLQALQTSARLRSQIDFEIDRQKSDQEYLEEKRDLELERLRLENDRIRNELTAPELDMAAIGEQAKENPEGLLASFAMKLFEMWQKNPPNAPVTQPEAPGATKSPDLANPAASPNSPPPETGRASPATADWSQDQPDEMFHAAQALIPPEQVAIARAMTKKGFISYLRGQVPAMNEKNLNRAYEILHSA
jgi:hypothetical protein